MSRDSNGNATVNRQRAVTGQSVLAEQVNVPFDDIQAMLNLVFWRDGLAPMTGNLNMNGFKINGLGEATNNDDAVILSQLAVLRQKFSSRTSGFQINGSNYNTAFQAIGNIEVTLADASELADDWFSSVSASTGTVKITPTAPQTINGLPSIDLSRGQRADIFKTSDTTFTSLISGGVWASKAIGEIYMVDTSVVGVDVPPLSATDVTYVQLTSGLTGVGQFNAGKLTNESVTGSAPLVNATAVISVAGSPLNGRTIRLLNSEGRILRPSATAGAIQNDAIQNITGGLRLNKTSSVVSGVFEQDAVPGNAAGGSDNLDGTQVTFDASRVVRTANETRMKNMGITAFMRVK